MILTGREVQLQWAVRLKDTVKGQDVVRWRFPCQPTRRIGSRDYCATGLAMHYETITRTVEIDFAHKKLIAGGGEFAKVILRMEPLPIGSGLQFVNDVADDVIPGKWAGGVQDGIDEASKTGVLAGHPVNDLRVTLIGGAYHDVDSNRHTFSLAARAAFWNGMRKAGPAIRVR
jgi:translation elongation factor EF-G